MILHWGWIFFVVLSSTSMVILLSQIKDLKERIRQMQVQEDDRFTKLLNSVEQALQRLRSEIDVLNQFKERIESEEKRKKKQGDADQSPAA